MNLTNLRIGHGYDVHRLFASLDDFVTGEEKFVILGGVKIPHTAVLVGHSDADVLVHAIIDALLGAAGLEDIGAQFPNTDAQYRAISSLKLLASTKNLIEKNNFSIANIDATIIAEAPKMRSHISEMRKNISETLGIDLNQINVKATTTEKLGFTGRREGIAAEAVVLLISGDS